MSIFGVVLSSFALIFFILGTKPFMLDTLSKFTVGDDYPKIRSHLSWLKSVYSSAARLLTFMLVGVIIISILAMLNGASIT